MHEVMRLGGGALAVILIAVAVLVRRRGSRQRSRAALATGQIALTTLLVVWAGLLLRHEVQLRLIGRHIKASAANGAVKVAALALRSDNYGTPAQRREFFERVLARLTHVPGIRVDDSGSALPLAGDAYFAMFFAIGAGSPAVQLPAGQRFVTWQARIGSDALASEVNHAVKTFDRGIHYWHVGSDASRVTFVVFGVYGVVALILAYMGLRGEARRRAMVTTALGIAIGLGLARATTWLLTGYLWGVSVTDVATFALSAGIVAGVVLFGSLVERRPAGKLALRREP